MGEEKKFKICEEGGGGLLLPLSEAEVRWAKPARGVVYLLVLLYMFSAVNIAADFFMSAIERITSKKKRIQNVKTGRYVTVLIWNDTVANLTLMALGSSAPEILLSVMETMSNKFYSGELGPGTIVGSAAFNILVIVAVCVCSIPSPEIRMIEQMAVFHVTVLFFLLRVLLVTNHCAAQLARCGRHLGGCHHTAHVSHACFYLVSGRQGPYGVHVAGKACCSFTS